MSNHPGTHKTHTLDLRSIIAAGEAPFAKVMQAVGAVREGETLLLVTPFLPSPLIEKLQAEGFSARPERQIDGSWQTSFRRE